MVLVCLLVFVFLSGGDVERDGVVVLFRWDFLLEFVLLAFLVVFGVIKLIEEGGVSSRVVS